MISGGQEPLCSGREKRAEVQMTAVFPGNVFFREVRDETS